MAKVTVTNGQIVDATNALSMLDKQDEKGKSIYKFDGVVRAAIYKRLRRLLDLSQDIEKTRARLATDNELTGEADEKGRPLDPYDNRKKFSDEYKLVLETKVEVEIGLLKLDDLKLDKNDIPVGVLANIDWLIEPTET